MNGAILDRQGKQVEITDLNSALIQAKEAVQFHRRKTGIKYPEVAKDWEHILHELQKIKKSNAQ